MVSEAVFNQVYERHSRSVYFNVLRIVNNEAVAEEILQDTFLRFLEKADPARSSEYHTFLIRISHNLAVDHVKRAARVNNIEDFGTLADSRDHTGESEARQLRDTIVSRLAQADLRYVKIFLLRVDYEMKYEEISHLLKIPKRSMRRHVENLKKIIKDVL